MYLTYIINISICDSWNDFRFWILLHCSFKLPNYFDCQSVILKIYFSNYKLSTFHACQEYIYIYERKSLWSLPCFLLPVAYHFCWHKVVLHLCPLGSGYKKNICTRNTVTKSFGFHKMKKSGYINAKNVMYFYLNAQVIYIHMYVSNKIMNLLATTFFVVWTDIWHSTLH